MEHLSSVLAKMPLCTSKGIIFFFFISGWKLKIRKGALKIAKSMLSILVKRLVSNRRRLQLFSLVIISGLKFQIGGGISLKQRTKITKTVKNLQCGLVYVIVAIDTFIVFNFIIIPLGNKYIFLINASVC